MIVIDTSAIIAILQNEPERAKFSARIELADRKLISAVSFQEAGFVLLNRRGVVGLASLSNYIAEIEAEIVPHDERLAGLAIAAFQRFGKGIHSRARLNFGDCATYALAQSLDAPLLYNGDDFAATDLTSALQPHPSSATHL